MKGKGNPVVKAVRRGPAPIASLRMAFWKSKTRVEKQARLEIFLQY